MKLPEHKASLCITHNDHKDNYQSAEEWLESVEDWCQWKDDESKNRAIETDSIWTLQWYPETPIGFHCVAAPTIEELLEYAATYSD